MKKTVKFVNSKNEVVTMAMEGPSINYIDKASLVEQMHLMHETHDNTWQLQSIC